MSRFGELAAAAAQRAGTLGGMVESIYRFVAFERCGHFPDLEDPRRFAALVLDGWEDA
jgi:pimeloyl-ACP methyl ester carboxylesterase